MLDELFDRYDFLTTVVPGAAFLFALAILFLPLVQQQPLALTAELLVVLVVAVFLVGEVVTMFTDTADPGQRLFAFMLLAAEVRLELDQIKTSIERQIEHRLDAESDSQEDLETTTSLLTKHDSDEVAEWSLERQLRWAWAHVWSLLFSAPTEPSLSSVLGLLTIRQALERGDDIAAAFEDTQFDYDDLVATTGTESDPATGDADSFPLPVHRHQWQLFRWVATRTNDDRAPRDDSERPPVDVWFCDDLWDELSHWADLARLGIHADSVQAGWVALEPGSKSNYTVYVAKLIERLERGIASFLPGPPWLSNRFNHTDPVPWTEEQSVRRLQHHFHLPPLRERLASLPTDTTRSVSSRENALSDWSNRSLLTDLYKRYTDVFRTLFTMVENDLGSQTERFRSRSVFHHNMWVTVSIVLLLFVGTMLFFIVGRLLNYLLDVFDDLQGVLRLVDAPFVAATSTMDLWIGRVFGVDWLVLAGMFVLGVLVLVREYDIRQHVEISYSWSVVRVALVSGIISVGFFELVSLARSLALLWTVLLLVLGLRITLSALVDWKHTLPQRTGFVVVLSVSFLLVVAAFVQIPLEDVMGLTAGSILALRGKVVGPGWLVFCTLLAFLLWLMFSVWTRKYEHEYLRYLLATYYTRHVHRTDISPNTGVPDADRSKGAGTDVST